MLPKRAELSEPAKARSGVSRPNSATPSGEPHLAPREFARWISANSEVLGAVRPCLLNGFAVSLLQRRSVNGDLVMAFEGMDGPDVAVRSVL